jgi:hypothetical protein
MAGLLSLAGTIAGASSFLQKDGQYVFLIPMKENGTLDIEQGRALQYWPAELTDSHSANYSVKTIPGGNVPLRQWVAGGERTFAFTATFSRDLQGKIGGSVLSGDIPESKHDVDVAAAIHWARSFLQPTYTSGLVKPPPALYLVFKNTQLGQGSDDQVLVVMTQCDVTYKKWFPDGTPRLAEVQLQFAEIVQKPVNTQFYGKDKWDAVALGYGWKKGGYTP